VAPLCPLPYHPLDPPSPPPDPPCQLVVVVRRCNPSNKLDCFLGQECCTVHTIPHNRNGAVPASKQYGWMRVRLGGWTGGQCTLRHSSELHSRVSLALSSHPGKSQQGWLFSFRRPGDSLAGRVPKASVHSTGTITHTHTSHIHATYTRIHHHTHACTHSHLLRSHEVVPNLGEVSECARPTSRPTKYHSHKRR